MQLLNCFTRKLNTIRKTFGRHLAAQHFWLAELHNQCLGVSEFCMELVGKQVSVSFWRVNISYSKLVALTKPTNRVYPAFEGPATWRFQRLSADFPENIRVKSLQLLFVVIWFNICDQWSNQVFNSISFIWECWVCKDFNKADWYSWRIFKWDYLIKQQQSISNKNL